MKLPAEAKAIKRRKRAKTWDNIFLLKGQEKRERKTKPEASLCGYFEDV